MTEMKYSPTEIKQAFIRFKNAHFSAVQTDTALLECNDDDRWVSLKKKTEKFWAASDDAEKNLKLILGIENERT